MPLIGCGTAGLQGDICTEVVQRALKIGYRHIDTANLYNNHTAIKKAIINSRIPREEIFLTSKIWWGDMSYNKVISQTEETLRDLGTSYLDLLLIHWPNHFIPLSHTLNALNKLYSEGKVNHIGVSNFSIRLVKKAISLSKIPLYTNQVEFHPYLYQKKLLHFCDRNKIFITAHSPNMRGALSGKVLSEIARRKNKSINQISLKWTIQKGVRVIPSSRIDSHLRENFDLFDFELNKEEVDTIDNLGISKRVIPLIKTELKLPIEFLYKKFYRRER